jgi:uncharacterized membrane protein HdeD (DUF308 family)
LTCPGSKAFHSQIQVVCVILLRHAEEVVMKWFLNILGVVMVLIGVVWFFQGINVLLGSFMSGDSLYAVLGIILVVVGIIILAFSNRSRKAVQDEGDSDPD